MAWADRCCLSVEFDKGAATFALNAFCCLRGGKGEINKYMKNELRIILQHTTGICSIAGKRGLNTLVTCLLGGGGARGGS